MDDKRPDNGRYQGKDDDYKDYSFGNFDDEVSFPSHGADSRPGKIKNYDEYANFNDEQLAADIKFGVSYDEDAVQTGKPHFAHDYDEDEDTPIVQAPEQSGDELPPPVTDYGDNFDSQTGEQQTRDFKYDLKTDDKGEYYTKSALGSGKMKPAGRRKSQHRSRNIAVVLTIAAVLCLAAAIGFAFIQCSSSNSSKTASASSSAAAEMVWQTTQDVTVYEGDDTKAAYTYAPTAEAAQTEAVQTEAPQTEAPAEEVQTEPLPTEAPQTEAPQTEAPAEEAPSSAQSEIESSEVQSSDSESQENEGDDNG